MELAQLNERDVIEQLDSLYDGQGRHTLVCVFFSISKGFGTSRPRYIAGRCLTLSSHFLTSLNSLRSSPAYSASIDPTKTGQVGDFHLVTNGLWPLRPSFQLLIQMVFEYLVELDRFALVVFNTVLSRFRCVTIK